METILSYETTLNFHQTNLRCIPEDLSIYGSTALVDPGRFFSSFIHTQTVELLGRGISPSQGRYLHTEQQTKNKRTQTFMLQLGFELTIPVFELAKIFHASDCAATVIDIPEH
jgi:hypothetical protein